MMNLRFSRLAIATTMALSVSVLAHTNERGLDLKNFDKTTAACQDFYQYSNGSWLKSNPIPEAYSRWGVFNEINERNLDLLKTVLEEAAAAKAAEGTNQQRIGDFYASGMDKATIEKLGYQPIQGELSRVAELKSNAEIMPLIADWHMRSVMALFDLGVEADMKNSRMNIIYASQGGLGLPERDYYLRDDAESKELREKYLTHMEKMFGLIGVSAKEAKQQAQWVLDLETTLAKASLEKVALRDPANSYHIFSVSEAEKHASNIGWDTYFKNLGVSGVESFSLAQPDFFAAADKALKEVPLDQWKAYLRWNLVTTSAPYLATDFVNESFNFYGKTLTGAKELRPRWKRVMGVVNDNVGEAVGELYVAKAFTPEAKQKAKKMVEHLKIALKDRINHLSWMSDATKKKALEKLATFEYKIGYPEKWRDYSTLDIARNQYYKNVVAANVFESKRQLAQANKPVDRSEWHMTPQTVNAYYNPLQNEIVFPAAILQPPMFDPTADDALNYGVMGGVIGHEFTHGFDDKGSQFDAQGNLKTWWTEEDRKEFESRTDVLVKQFDGYVAIDDLHVNGKLTLGENIADLGGLLVAYEAYQMTDEFKAGKKIDGFTPAQRFFLSWSQGGRSNYRDEQLKLQVNTDPHSPPKFRVNGPLSNIPAFHEAFSCKAGDAMVSGQKTRVDIW